MTKVQVGHPVTVQTKEGPRSGTLLRVNPITVVVRLDRHGTRPAKTIKRHHADLL